MRPLLLLLAITTGALAQKNGDVLPLWPGGAPGSENMTERKEVVTQPAKSGDSLKVSNIHKPSLIVYFPPKEKATGAAMIVAPGGGHRFLSIDTEGTNVAEWLNSVGVAAFVLKYRLAREPDSPYKVEEHPFADVQRAIRVVRARSAEWHVNPAKIGVMGFSAGGEVAVMASTRYDMGRFREQYGTDYATALDLVFANPNGSPLRPDSVSASISLLCRRLKLPPGASLHTLRHTHATHMLVGGVPLQVVSERLGHSSVRVTAEVYAHSLRGQDDEAVRKLEEFQRASRSAAGVPAVEQVQ